MISLPNGFVETLPFSNDLNEKLIVGLNSEPYVSIRINPFKEGTDLKGTPVSWCKNGVYLEKRPEFIADPNFHAGLYYSQEASSMFLEQFFNLLDLENNVVLDLCAAPGGKSTHINSLLPPSALQLSNEIVKSRAWILKENMDKWGSSNVIVTNNTPEDFEQYMGLFDVVVADAPCSGEGMFRKDLKSRDEWSIQNVEKCTIRQKNILQNIVPTIKDGGVLIYSTCTFNNEENINQLKWLQDNYEVEPLLIEKENIPTGVEIIQKNGVEGYQFLPGITKGEGFFIAAVKVYGGRTKLKMPKRIKKLRLDDAGELKFFKEHPDVAFSNFVIKDNVHRFPAAFDDIIRCVIWDLSPLKIGCCVGQILDSRKGRSFKYSHELALSHEINQNQFEKVEVNQKDAIAFLQKKEISFIPTIKSWGLIVYNDQPLGWVKKVGNRVNNYHPKEYRIRKSF